MLGRQDCKNCDSPRACGWLQGLASLSNTQVFSPRAERVILGCIPFPRIVRSVFHSVLSVVTLRNASLSAEPSATIRPPWCRVPQVVHNSAQEPPTPGFGGESEGRLRLARLKQKLNGRGELLKAAVETLQAKIAKKMAALEDWHIKNRMMPELLKAVISLEALVDPRTVSGNTSPLSLTDTPSSRKRVKMLFISCGSFF